jgi:hypothetical protein
VRYSSQQFQVWPRDPNKEKENFIDVNSGQQAVISVEVFI